MYKKIIILSLLLVLMGCGEETKTVNSGGEEVIVENTNKVELGPVSGASVKISTLDGQNLYTTLTDDLGQYTIELELFKSRLESISPYPEYVLVTATGGIDTDPEDDGDTTNSESIPVNGVVKGIFKSETLLNNEDLSINLLSTVVSELVKGKKNIDDEKLNNVIKSLGIEDINNDGIINSEDVYLYKMSEHDSSIEEKLRANYLSAIHSGDNDRLSSLTEEIAKENNLLFIQYSISNNQAYLDIESPQLDTKILYAINPKQDDTLNNTYSDSIILNKNDFLVYKECRDNICSEQQIASFDGQKIYQYYLRVSNFGIFNNEEEVNTLRIQIHNDIKKRNILEDKQESISEQIKDLKDKLAELKS